MTFENNKRSKRAALYLLLGASSLTIVSLFLFLSAFFRVSFTDDLGGENPYPAVYVFFFSPLTGLLSVLFLVFRLAWLKYKGIQAKRRAENQPLDRS